MNHDYREAWLSDLGRKTGLTTLAFDQAGVCQLMLDGDLVLTIHKPDTSVKLVIFGQLPIPPLPIEIAKEMLKRNRSHAKLAMPVISLSPEEDAIEVHLILDQAELEQGEDAIEKLIAELAYWKKAALSDFLPKGASEKIDPNISFV
jgi:hypothetical protein